VQRHTVITTIALSVALAGTARAQFTTVMTAPAKKPKAAAVAGVPQAKRDSITRTQLSDMRAWVDSAAGVAVLTQAGDVTQDSLVTPSPVQPAPAAAPAATTQFRNGATAPNTASPLPLLVLLGVGALALGAAVLARSRA
jgi:hypothetical protein